MKLGAPIRIKVDGKWIRLSPEIRKIAAFLSKRRLIEPLGSRQGIDSK
jgi:hypothetical protein